MTVSSEPRSRRVVLPEVVGLSLDDAHTVLALAGVDDVSIRYAEAYAPDREVVEQLPRAGQLMERARQVELVVARQNVAHYLPQVYQQEATEGASFLKGFLYIVQHVYDSVDHRVGRLSELFDPRSTDPEFLPWLASWLAITLSPDWDELERRRMLLAATRLFPFRGTSRAIREFVRIYTDAEVTIEENAWPFSGFRIGAASEVGRDAVILPPMNLAHCFIVRLDRPASAVTEDEIVKIHRIIQSQKPAHTMYFLAFSDETDGGAMGSFMEVGLGAIGLAPEEADEAGSGSTADGQGLTAEAHSWTAADWRRKEREVREQARQTWDAEIAERGPIRLEVDGAAPVRADKKGKRGSAAKGKKAAKPSEVTAAPAEPPGEAPKKKAGAHKKGDAAKKADAAQEAAPAKKASPADKGASPKKGASSKKDASPKKDDSSKETAADEAGGGGAAGKKASGSADKRRQEREQRKAEREARKKEREARAAERAGKTGAKGSKGGGKGTKKAPASKKTKAGPSKKGSGDKS